GTIQGSVSRYKPIRKTQQTRELFKACENIKSRYWVLNRNEEKKPAGFLLPVQPDVHEER
ncbi:hypothetical protein, partial [Chitinophaga sp.]|uniref:hypothetical protein n=1 Tax=Chitinophaga sp. TaxID=1869181 RepID=UPI00261EA0F1